MLTPALFFLLAIPDRDGFLRQICPASHIKQINHVAHCDVCPNWDETPDMEEYLPVLEKVIRGHFTSRSRNEALVYFHGCGGQQNPGFTILFRKVGTRWQKIKNQDMQLDVCRIYQDSTDPDRLICSEGPRHRGFVANTQRVLTTANDGSTAEQALYWWIDSRYDCGLITTRTEENLELIDLNQYGTKDIRTTLRVWQGPGRHDSRGLCQTGMPTVHTLTFLFRAGRFNPTQETVQNLKKLKVLFAADHSFQ